MDGQPHCALWLGFFLGTLDMVYKYLYNFAMSKDASKSRIKWEGDSREIIRTWPKEVKENIGGDLQRLEDHEQPLDSKSMGQSLRGVSELRDEHQGVWYRLLYALHRGWIYVLHCFTKKTNQTSKGDIDLAKERLKNVKARNDEKFGGKEEKGA